jgi:plasmid segregation protein ParM
MGTPMNIFCDDGSTNVKLAWFKGSELESFLSGNSFRNGWKVEGMGSSRTYNYLLDGQKYTYDPVSEAAISTTHIEYQYSDVNVLAVHHALLTSGLPVQDVSLTVTLPISEFYTQDCQKNLLNIQRKIDNLMRPVTLNKGESFTIVSVDVMPESLPAVFTRLVTDKVGQYEKSLVIDLGGTTLDIGVIVGQFEDVSSIHGNSRIGVSLVTKPVLSALRMASSDTSAMIADELIKRRNDAEFVSQVINDESKKSLVLETIESAITSLGEQVVDELREYRNVNRIYIVGGGASLIAPAITKSWQHLGDKVVLMDEPQTALVKAIARYKGE